MRVNGKTGRPDPLRQGDEVQLWMPPPEPLPYLKPEPMDLDVLFEDDHLIVINKPAGLTVHPPRQQGRHAGEWSASPLPRSAGHQRQVTAGIVHRLDKDTTGCIVIARSQEALVRLQVQIQKRIASRSTSRWCMGYPGGFGHDRGGDRTPSGGSQVRRGDGENGRYACTHWTLLERLGDYSLCGSSSTPGGPIRSGAHHMNHPVVGIPYSRCRKLPMELPGQALQRGAGSGPPDQP